MTTTEHGGESLDLRDLLGAVLVMALVLAAAVLA